MDDPRAAGRLLARRHRREEPTPPERTLLDHAEIPRDDDWSLRSGLVRVAQRDADLASRVLEAVRRCDAALHPFRRALETHPAITDRCLGTGDGSTRLTADDGGEAADPVVDARAVDLARLLRAAHREGVDDEQVTADLVAGYREELELADDEAAAVPLLVAALELDEVAAVVAGWAVTAAEPVPDDEIDRLRSRAWEALERAGAPREQPTPPGVRSRRG